MPYLYLVRHPKTHVDPMRQPHQWELSEQGRAQAKVLSTAPFWKHVTALYSSNQLKAMEAARIVASEHSMAIVPLTGLAEVGRGPQVYSTAGDYNNILERFFSHPNRSVSDWESSDAALERFQATVEQILARHSGESIALLSHGTILTLYTAMLDKVPPTLARWHQIDFSSVAAVDIETMQMVTTFITEPYDNLPVDTD